MSRCYLWNKTYDYDANAASAEDHLTVSWNARMHKPPEGMTALEEIKAYAKTQEKWSPIWDALRL